jgi:hypothetical protein
MVRSQNRLIYSVVPSSRRTVSRQYLKWRASQGLPLRCDNPECRFHAEELLWNEQPLSTDVDHENGNKCDNRPENLRLLCPNCNSQLATRGGKNRGRVQNASALGYEIAHRDGRRDANVFPVGIATIASVGSPHVTASGQDLPNE